MRKFLLASVIVLAFASNSRASIFVSCGLGAVSEDQKFAQQELTTSSGNDDFSGPIDGEWNVTLGNSAASLAPAQHPRAAARLVDIGNRTDVEIALPDAGKTGIVYLVHDVYAEAPKLEKFEFAGFDRKRTANLGKKLGDFACVSAND